MAADALNRRIELHTCRQHHVMLRHILAEFPANEPLPGPIMIVLLGRLRSILTRHLKLEDEHVYPALTNAADERVRTTAREFRLEMGGLMRAFDDFDRRYPHAESIDRDPKGFMEEWVPLRRALEMRMDAEDGRLYGDAEAYFNDALTIRSADS